MQGDRRGILDTRTVAPETTDVITHVNNGGARRMVRTSPPPRAPRPERIRRQSDDLVFGAIPKMTIGLISLGFMFVITLIFGIKELDMSIPVFLIVLIFCTVMGVLLSHSPGFVCVVVSAMLLIVGGLTELFPAVALGVAMLVSASLIIRGE